ncbi:MAG TPA: 2-C-methyl-D-erythritol 4-phosphate cytidylyltransferase, partial [Steroidobacteraceae bacterium]|nr:2-C-methyl-D-erythritol 4-phosphate cytidylyltransferase [Steroidobacteraceae bacterium]
MSAPAPRRFWAIVPAAGRGERFASAAATATPKQYTLLLGRSVLEWSLRALLCEPRIEGIVVVLASGDERWPEVAGRLNSPKLMTAIGGAHRQDSVMSGLEFLASRAAPGDWVMVHDAARPCVSGDDIGALADAVANSNGAVLAAPIVDTVKRAGAEANETVDRTGLWRALTPQVFAYAQLRRALREAADAGAAVTDEAQAMERIGIRAALVAGS